MALDTAAVQQPNFNIETTPNFMQNREILDNSGFTGAVKSIADVLQNRQDEVKDSYNKMTDTLAEVDARDQSEFLSIIEENRNQLKGLARKGVNNKDYIAAKARIFSDLASKKKQSESFTSQLAEAYKYSQNPTSYSTAEFNRKLQELQNTPLSKRRGNEIQQLMSDPTLHNVDKMIADAVIKTYGKEVEESYAVKKGNDVYKGTYVYNPLYSLKKNSSGEIDIDNPELNLTPDVINRIVSNTARPDLVKQKLDLVMPDKLSDAGAGPISEADAFTSKLSSIIAQVIPQPRLKDQDIKLGSTSGATTASKDAKKEESIKIVAQALADKDAKTISTLLSSKGATGVKIYDASDEMYIITSSINKANVNRAITKAEYMKDYRGNNNVIPLIGIHYKQNGENMYMGYNPENPEIAAGDLYQNAGSPDLTLEKLPSKEGKKSIAEIMREAAKNKK